MCSWKLSVFPVKLEGGKGEVRVGDGGLLLAATVLESGPGLAEQLQQQIAAEAAATTRAEPAVFAEAARRLAAPGASDRKPVAFIQPRNWGSTPTL